ncbi:MAG: DNA repair protein [Lachnospiraceae bacterium]|nr:DNA repair protein [Lachnospiraceae bacterium]
MSNKNEKSMLKKLSRQDLLEMLIQEEKRIDQLEKELAEAREALKDRQIRIDTAGSIAEAALKLNGIFEAAQAAADQYLENIRQQQTETGREAQ